MTINANIRYFQPTGYLTTEGLAYFAQFERQALASVAWADVTGKPATFPPSAHTHTVAQISDFPALGTAAAADVTDFATAAQGALAASALQPGDALPWADLTGVPVSFPPSAHGHTAGEISGLATVATTGAYGDLSGLPTLGGAAALNVGTTAGTVAAGNDSRMTNSREWTASTVSQAEAEAGTATTRRAWTAQRVRQAILGWWNGSADKAKLDGIAAGATANTGTVTSVSGTGTASGLSLSGTVTTSGNITLSGTVTPAWGDITGIPAAISGTTAAFTTAQETKLAGIATGATANATDAALRDRATHTGTQAASTITGLATVATSGAYADLSGLPSLFDGTWTSLSGKPATFTPAAHTHPWSEVTSTPTTLAGYGITDAVALSGDQTIAGDKTFTGNVSGIHSSGSNANGRWIRFNDGMQVCTRAATTADVTTATGGLFMSAVISWTFPQAFVSTDDLTGFVSGSNAENFWGIFRRTSTTAANIRLFSPTSATGRGYLVTAVGRWV